MKMGAARPLRTCSKCRWNGSRVLLLQDDRHRAVVHELEHHSGSEHAGLDRHPTLAELRAEALVDRLGPLGPGWLREAGSIAPHRVGEQRELAHDERRAA